MAVWVPYLLLTVLVDFHVHRFQGGGLSIASGVTSVSAPSGTSSQSSGSSCAICQLQRISVRLVSHAAVGPGRSMPAVVAPVETAHRDSPVPHPSSFRGPPRSYSA
jgi:hypothetical protein